MTDVKKIPAYAVITRALYESGEAQREAIKELERRGLWLSDEQKKQAGLKGEDNA